MKRVLVLAYHFPPVGGGGVQRTLKLVRDLPALGWEPVVLTGPGTTEGRWTPEDQSLARQVPADLEIIRLDGEPRPSGSGRRRTERWLGVGSPFCHWWIDGTVGAGTRVADIDLVYATMSPFESAEAAARIAAATGRPWVADLRDPWALDEVAVHPTRLHRGRELRRMRRLLAGADAVIMNTPEATRQLVWRFPEIRADKVRTIPNGFDELDFEGPDPSRTDGAFRIVHAGYLHAELGRRLRRGHGIRRLLGGFVTDVDLVSRSHVYLVEALDRLARSDRSPRLPIEAHLAGIASPGDRALGAGEAVRYRGYLPHDEAVLLIRSADLLFLPMHDLPAGSRATIVPGKTYEYLASGRPILAAVPDGDARDLLAESPNAHLCRPADVDRMAAIIGGLAEDVATDGRVPSRRPAAVVPFERRRLAERLASTFDATVGRAPVSDAVGVPA